MLRKERAANISFCTNTVQIEISKCPLTEKERQEQTVRVTFEKPEFIAKVKFDERGLAQRAGFIFQKERGVFTTTSVRAAHELLDFADPLAVDEIDKKFIRVKHWAEPLWWPQGLCPKSYQVEAAQFILSRNRSYNALPAGLGKTVVAALVMNARDNRVVYICPPFLIKDVEGKLAEWGVDMTRVLIVPDSQLNKAPQFDLVTAFAQGGSADLYVDEAHRFNSASQRAESLFTKIYPLFKFVCFMSGTPMRNRPIELYPVLHHAAPETIGFASRFEYGRKYCAAFLDRVTGHWDFSGASNLHELKERVHGTFMFRRDKSVLNLPPKMEELVMLSADMSVLTSRLDKKILAQFSPEDLLGRELGGDNEHISTYRKNLGLEKAKASIPYLKSILEETDDNLIIAAVHKEAVRHLMQALVAYGPLLIDGSVPVGLRVNVAHRFQGGESRVIVLNIQAGGVGFDLTRADRVCLVEYSWVPAENSQLTDRAHRYGRKDPVLCQYFAFQNSIDRAVLETSLYKESVINRL